MNAVVPLFTPLPLPRGGGGLNGENTVYQSFVKLVL